MSADAPARFDGVDMSRQFAQELETAMLRCACFRDVVVPAASTEASIVDRAWEASDARYKTVEEIKAYAQQMRDLAERFCDGVDMSRQRAREFETSMLKLACFRGAVVPAASTEASIVDSAWEAPDARYSTKQEIKEYAETMWDLVERFFDNVHGGPRIILRVEDAQDPDTCVHCRMNMLQKLEVAIDTYLKNRPGVSIQQIEYNGMPFPDKRVYPYNTPHALGMEQEDVIRVFHQVVQQDAGVKRKLVEQDAGIDRKKLTKFKICMLGAEGLVEESFVDYMYSTKQSFDGYAQKFCTRKGLDASKVCFMHGGQKIVHDEGKTICEAVHFNDSSYIHKPGPLMIYALPKAEFESNPDDCFVPGACPEEQVHAVEAAVATRPLRDKRKVKKMNL